MKHALTIMLLLAAASVSPLIFPIAQSGRSSMDILAKFALLPSAAILLLVVGLLYRAKDSLAKICAIGLAAGAVGTVALEAFRLPGFWLGFMPGNLPRLMGVLLLDQFASGPSLKSDIVGWIYHFWNGACFGLIYVLVFGTCRRWVGAAFGVLLGFGFMLSPVVSSLGVGFLGLEFSKGFPVTVTVAHAAFGFALSWLAASWLGFIDSPLAGALCGCAPGHLATRRDRLSGGL
ncbi:MAG: hypothetical protein KGO02_22075 [Alphaproteobacteria bacterium]|nr:hypothetical protein [Alphaproteobacteria bacterium]